MKDRDKREQESGHALADFLSGVQRQGIALARGALWDLETARDVVQDSMTRLVQYYRDRPSGEWPALFRTIINNRINDVRRERMANQARGKVLSFSAWKRHDDPDAEHGDFEPPALQPEGNGSWPEAAAHGRQLQEHIQAAVAALPTRQREVFLLREQAGCSIRETAETLDCSETSVKQHHFRAMRALRESLKEVWQHEQLD